MPASSASTSTDSPDAERIAGIVAARRAVVVARCHLAPRAWREWAEAELSDVPAPSVAPSDAPFDRQRDPAIRERLGQVYTPPHLANALVRFIGAHRPGSVLDPAAGDGSLLCAVADARLGARQKPADILNSCKGWDIDPIAAALCRLSLLDWGLRNALGPAPEPLQVECRDGLGAEPVDWLLCNPPYLEAKRMGRAQPGLRERLKASYPDLTGAFDLYLAFALDALENAGEAGLILPNKVCQGRYARLFRARVLREGRLAGILDLSRMRPRAFKGTGVYPVFLHLGEKTSVRVGRVMTSEALSRPAVASTPVETLERVGGESPWFVPFETWSDLAPCFSLPERLGDIAKVVSTCSFHKRGLREQFVGPERPADHAFPYLGGPSRTRQTEIQPFSQRWAGWWIAYDQRALKEDHNNPLPPLANFTRPKVVFNQHDRRLSAFADFDGRFVTKDVYPIAWPTDPRWNVALLTALFNCSVVTALYNTVFQGIVVGGETYHYLPAFLKSLPVPDPEGFRAVADLVAQQQAGADHWEAIDQALCAAYGLDEPARQRLIDVHLTRVGAPTP